MKISKYSAEQLEFLRENFPKMGLPELTEAFNRKFRAKKPVNQIKYTLKNHKIRCGRKGGHRTGKYLLLTDDQVDFVKEYFQEFTIRQTTMALNEEYGISMTENQIKTFCSNHGIKSGRSGCFQKSHKPWNTGTKGLTGPNDGSFKKGNVPGNIVPLGSERFCKKDGDILVKIAEQNPYTCAPTRFKHKSVHVWEKHYGPVPEGFVVSFRDGDKLNCSPDNLMLLDRAELLRINQYRYRELPAELKPSVLGLSKMEVKMFRAARKLDEAEPMMPKITPSYKSPALHHKSPGYQWGCNVPKKVIMTNDLIVESQKMGNAVILVRAGMEYEAYVTSHGAVAIAINDCLLSVRYGEYMVSQWHEEKI